MFRVLKRGVISLVGGRGGLHHGSLLSTRVEIKVVYPWWHSYTCGRSRMVHVLSVLDCSVCLADPGFRFSSSKGSRYNR